MSNSTPAAERRLANVLDAYHTEYVGPLRKRLDAAEAELRRVSVWLDGHAEPLEKLAFRRPWWRKLLGK